MASGAGLIVTFPASKPRNPQRETLNPRINTHERIRRPRTRTNVCERLRTAMNTNPTQTSDGFSLSRHRREHPVTSPSPPQRSRGTGEEAVFSLGFWVFLGQLPVTNCELRMTNHSPAYEHLRTPIHVSRITHHLSSNRCPRKNPQSAIHNPKSKLQLPLHGFRNP
jgi:hypothetical protein